MKKLMKSVLACALAFAMVLTVMPVNTYAANKKTVVVTNQKQLEKALKSGATNIVIKTNKNVKITIPASKKAEKASISVQAKNATVTNKASVKSIEIKDAKAFVESGKNNDIKITDSKLSLTVSKSSKGADIQVAKKDADIKVVAKGDVASVTVAKTANVALTVNKTAKVDTVNVAAKGASVDLNAKGTVSDVKVTEKAADTKLNINASGKVENVQIDAKTDVTVAGSTTEAVKVTVNAKDTTIKAETAVDTTLNADTKLDLSKGAEGSKVTTAENVKADVANNTTDKVTVKDSTGKETTVDAGKTETKTDDGKTDDEKKVDQKTDDNSGTVTPAPTPTPIPEYPKVEFTSSSDPLTGTVTYDDENNDLKLTVDFYPGDYVYDSKGEKTENYWFDVTPIGDNLVTYDDDASDYDERAVLVFHIDGTPEAGSHTLQFDYSVYYPEDTLIGKKRFIVNYNIDSSKIPIPPYAREIIVTSTSELWIDFSKDVSDDTGKVQILITKDGEENAASLVISKIGRYEDQRQRYVVTLNKDLENGTYRVEAIFGGRKNQENCGSFTYDSSVWENMNKVQTAVQALMEKGCTISDTSGDNKYAEAFRKELDKNLSQEEILSSLMIDVSQGASDKDGKVWIVVYIRNGCAMYTEMGYVSFVSASTDTTE